MRRTHGLAVLGVLLVARPAIATPIFQGLGFLPGSGAWSYAEAVSADGSRVVGRSCGAAPDCTEAFVWDAVNGMQGLGALPGTSAGSGATDVSADGSVVVGLDDYDDSAPGDMEAFRWEAGSMTPLPMPPGALASQAYGVSADGSVVVGSVYASGPAVEAFRWDAGVPTGLGDLPGGDFSSSASAVSADGAVVVGTGSTTVASVDVPQAFRWEAGVMTGLGSLPGGDPYSFGRDVSADGSIVVGFAGSASGGEAFRWEDGMMLGLGDLPGGGFDSLALAVSADGSVVVGRGAAEQGFEAFLWDPVHGMRPLADVLAVGYGVDLTGWSLESAQDVSADGRTIVGYGTNPDGRPEGWVVVIPEPASAFLVALGLAAMALAAGIRLDPAAPRRRVPLPGSGRAGSPRHQLESWSFSPRSSERRL